MNQLRQKITSYLLNNNLFFVEIIALALPILMFSVRNDAVIDLILIKNLLFIWISLLSIQILAPAIYKAYEPNSKFKKESLLKKIEFYFKILFFFALIVVSTKLLKNYLSPHNFTLLLITLFLKILVIKSRLDSFSILKIAIIRFCLLTTLSFLASLVFLELILLPASLLAISVGCLLTGFSLIDLYLPSKNCSAKTLRLPGMFYLLHAGLQSIYVILELTYPWHFLGLFLTPLIVKMTPIPNSEISLQILNKFLRLNILVFVLFLGIMLFMKG